MLKDIEKLSSENGCFSKSVLSSIFNLYSFEDENGHILCCGLNLNLIVDKGEYIFVCL